MYIRCRLCLRACSSVCVYNKGMYRILPLSVSVCLSLIHALADAFLLTAYNHTNNIAILGNLELFHLSIQRTLTGDNSADVDVILVVTIKDSLTPVLTQLLESVLQNVALGVVLRQQSHVPHGHFMLLL